MNLFGMYMSKISLVKTSPDHFLSPVIAAQILQFLLIPISRFAWNKAPLCGPCLFDSNNLFSKSIVCTSY